MHILTLKPTTTAKEVAQLKDLDPLKKRYLSRRVCALCEHPADVPGCGNFYEACPEDVRVERRERCLNEYKPRPRKKDNHEQTDGQQGQPAPSAE